MPVNEAEVQLALAKELDRAQYFHRDGTPVALDLLRLLSGDMHENTFPEEITLSDPKKPIPKKVTVIVYDISGSMGQHNKHVLQKALSLSYIDFAHTEVVTGKAEHADLMMAFDTRAHDPERISSVAQAQEHFDRQRTPFGSGGGTSITAALVAVYEKIAQHQKEGGELDRANILLITDGEDTLDHKQIDEARTKVDPSVEIVLNSITMGEENKDLKNMVQRNRDESKGRISQVRYQFIPYTQVAEILNSTERLKNLEAAATQFDASADRKLSNDALIRLKHELSRLDSEQELQDRVLTGVGRGMREALEKPGAAKPDKEVEALVELFLETTDSAIARGWSAGAKIQAFTEFVRELAREYRIEESAVLGRMSTPTKKRVLRWIGP